ncbi:hypothetical protein ACNOYE_12315 [Nannocystaceae bacterium ST9]
MRTLRVGVGLLALAALSACQRPSPTGMQLDSSVREPSGIVVSAQHEGVLWTHPDSGNGNWLFAVDRSGKSLARLRVENVENIDWEDIARDDRGNLWLADIGNNESDRRDLALHRVPEPDPASASESVRADLSVHFRYADQSEFGRAKADFDAESLFWWDGRLWLLTKHRSDCSTKLYRFPAIDEASADELVLEPVARFDLGEQLGTGYPASAFPCQVSAADVDDEGERWALLTYDAVFVFDLPAPGSVDLFAKPVGRIALDPAYVRQVEALAFEGDDLLLVNEERAMFRLDQIGTRERYP